jgi:hypothetical protein
MNSQFPISVLPYRRHQKFFGRAAELQQLSNLLDPSNTAPTSPGPRTVLIRGLGGVGKTQLALEYAYAHRTRYDAIFWLKGDAKTALETSCREAVQKLGLAIDPRSSGKEILLFSKWLADTGTGMMPVCSPSSNLYRSAISPHYRQPRGPGRTRPNTFGYMAIKTQ